MDSLLRVVWLHAISILVAILQLIGAILRYLRKES